MNVLAQNAVSTHKTTVAGRPALIQIMPTQSRVLELDCSGEVVFDQMGNPVVLGNIAIDEVITDAIARIEKQIEESKSAEMYDFD